MRQTFFPSLHLANARTGHVGTDPHVSDNPTYQELQSQAEETGLMASSLHTRTSRIGASRIQGQASRTGQAECRRTGLFPRQRKWEAVGSAGTHRQTSYNAAALAPGVA